jgi:hypothetical protein
LAANVMDHVAWLQAGPCGWRIRLNALDNVAAIDV